MSEKAFRLARRIEDAALRVRRLGHGALARELEEAAREVRELDEAPALEVGGEVEAETRIVTFTPEMREQMRRKAWPRRVAEVS